MSVQPPPPPPPQPYGCTAVGLGPNSLSCLDLSLLLLYIIFLAGLVWAALHWRVFACFAKRQEGNGSARAPLLDEDLGATTGDADWGEEHMYSYLEQRLRPLFYRLVSYCCCTWHQVWYENRTSTRCCCTLLRELLTDCSKTAYKYMYPLCV